MLGKLLDRRYQVTQVLGAGGFGRTYLAQDTRRPGNPTCVVKQLKPLTSEPSFLETARRLFNSEAETLEQLGNHDHITRLLAYFEEDQEFYLVQEYIEGHTLSQELQPGQRWDESRVIDLLKEVLGVLEFVHHHGVIHRDIKPDNLIRRNSDQKLVLVDFGAVKQIRTQMASAYGQPSATVAVGTPGYMPSEQALGQPRPSSDIYALGVIAIQALTGLMPVSIQEDLNTGELLWQHLVSVSRGFANILTKMVRYHFKDRYQTASEVLQALQQLNASYPPTTPYNNLPRYPSGNEFPNPQQTSPQPNYPPTPPNYPPTPPSQHNTLAASPASPRQPVAASPSYTSSSNSSSLPFVVGAAMVITVIAGFGLAYAIRQNSFPGGGTNVLAGSEGSCTVKTDLLNVRSGPGTNQNVVNTVQKGRTLALTGSQQNGWVEISSPVRGWVFNGSKFVDCNLANQKPPEPVASQPPVETPPPKPSPVKPKPVDNGAKDLEKAAEAYEKGDLLSALKLAQSVASKGSEYRDEAVAKIAQWQKEWAAAEAQFKQIQQAFNEGDWDKVLIHESDTDFPEQRYWREQLNKLIDEAKRRKAEENSQGEPTPSEPTPGEQSQPEPTPSVVPTQPSTGEAPTNP
ncbi:MAG: protein kinase [Symplocastrum torsivum CPER-KK1]|jgi:serine/threonine-protein kinase|uniref:non-specific serine/threonine protein kinase n=1 Tax=Symplocastrum torsivum CPER-KK1 TaxID=450513 RepID=A0A951UB74_9CYAN|nr:protein kinase [Symplocastrum torsivum CPER-KK1]